MSPTVNNFVHDLVAMAKAMEDLPVVQAALQERDMECARHLDTIQSRELAILEYKATIDHQVETIRSLEVARDDAELRFLELDDKVSKVLAVRSSLADTVNNLFDALEPPRPVVSEVKPADTIPSWATPEVDHTGDYIPKAFDDGGPYNEPLPPQGQSEADPTANTAQTGTEVLGSEAGTPMNSVADPAPKPYAGKRYSEAGPNGGYPNFITWSDWEAGGGTLDNYNN